MPANSTQVRDLKDADRGNFQALVTLTDEHEAS